MSNNNNSNKKKSSKDNPPNAFVRWSEVQNILNSANKDGVKCSVLLNLSGDVLAVGGDKNQVIGALIANTWQDYRKSSNKCFQSEHLYIMLYHCADGQIAVTRLGRFLLCMLSDTQIPVGLLKNKLSSLSATLENQLAAV